MYLKSIEVHGFKSFANKINFQFHNGITGIVGPNGSGKSNVADAVRWVLGEQSAKQLRGASMQDVIFSGTENRKPLGYAYVAITLDNSDHQLVIDYEEVTITRRVYRSGESEYLINGTNCRLKDVNELFYDTGIGKEGYSIIGQGQIDKILSGKPEDRRELFDEAAGIVKYKRRKATAQKKLEDERNNLVRVNDILGELEKQVEPLEKQSEVAKVYLKKKEELKTLDVNMFLMETERIKGQLQSVQDKNKIASDNLDETNKQYDNIKDEYEKLEIEIEELEAAIDKKRAEISDTNILRGKLEGQINVLKEQINSAKLSDEHLKNRFETIQGDLYIKRNELDTILVDKSEIDSVVSDSMKKRDEARVNLLAVQAELEELNNKIETGKNEIIDALNERSTIKAKMGRYDTMLEQVSIRKAELNSKLLRVKSDEAEHEEAIKAFEDRLAKINDTIRVLEENTVVLEEQSEILSQEIDSKDKVLRDTQVTYHEKKSKLESLKNLTERYEGYGNSIRKVMEKKENYKGICGVVADLIKVDKKYETAIETALSGNIQNIVTEDEETAKKMISYLKENKLGRATFLPLTSVQQREFNAPEALKEKGVIGMADTLVTIDKKYGNISSHLLGNYIVMDNVENALALCKKFRYTLRCVTLNGEALNPGGSISGGAFRNSSNLLGRNREIEELEKNVKDILKEIDKVLNKMEEAKEKRISIRREIEELKTQKQEQFILQNTTKMNVNQAVQKREDTEKGVLELKTEGNEIEDQILEIQQNKETIRKELEDSEKLEKATEELITAYTKTLEEKKTIESELTLRVNELELEVANLFQKQEFEQHNVERIQGEIKRLQDEESFINGNLAQTAEDVEKKYADITEIEKTMKASESSSDDSQGFLKEKLQMKEELTVKQKNFFKTREELSENRNALDKEVFRLNNQIEKLEESAESQINYMWNEYEITYNQALEMRDQSFDDLSLMKRSIIALKSSIRELGDVNVNAIEDYKNLMERYEFLRTQRDDLINAEESLITIIEELDEAMRKQFEEKFAEISKQFDKVFKELFGGGKGTLELMEDEDILEAGIKIIAQPPGKKLQNMMQLSGGEKALTAIALLFAIQNLKPSPFCLLDEIEAALDESNVGRFAAYLTKLTKNTQFIVITHRRGTMEKADRLYGITMQEKGVSALVSVNLIDNELDN
ncbi:MAG: chromosome segregation protein SMC [Lachnospiraceae bacterium]|nr:chromosome segregation protein SMC [Lachnospiraceae bacterium]